jgi:hypothetical protein
METVEGGKGYQKGRMVLGSWRLSIYDFQSFWHSNNNDDDNNNKKKQKCKRDQNRVRTNISSPSPSASGFPEHLYALPGACFPRGPSQQDGQLWQSSLLALWYCVVCPRAYPGRGLWFAPREGEAVEMISFMRAAGRDNVQSTSRRQPGGGTGRRDRWRNLMSSVPAQAHKLLYMSAPRMYCAISNNHVSATGSVEDMKDGDKSSTVVRKGIGRRKMDTLTRRGRHRATIIAINSRDDRYPQIRIKHG